MTGMMDLLSVSGNWRWPEGRAPLVITNHGDHLYGTALTSNGRVVYCVLTDVQGKHVSRRVENGVTVLMVDFGTWLNQCAAGRPHALEAMFAPNMVDGLDKLQDNYRVWVQDAASTYSRAIDLLCRSDEISPKVHALRLAWNMREMRETGRFNPTLHPIQVRQYRKVAENYDGPAFQAIAQRAAWI